MEDDLPIRAGVQTGDNGNGDAGLLGAGLGCSYCLLSDGSDADYLIGLLNGEAGDVHNVLLFPRDLRGGR